MRARRTNFGFWIGPCLVRDLLMVASLPVALLFSCLGRRGECKCQVWGAATPRPDLREVTALVSEILMGDSGEVQGVGQVLGWSKSA